MAKTVSSAASTSNATNVARRAGRSTVSGTPTSARNSTAQVNASRNDAYEIPAYPRIAARTAGRRTAGESSLILPMFARGGGEPQPGKYRSLAGRPGALAAGHEPRGDLRP